MVCSDVGEVAHESETVRIYQRGFVFFLVDADQDQANCHEPCREFTTTVFTHCMLACFP